MELVGSEFSQVLASYHESWLPARVLVKEALAKRFDVDPSGQIMLLDNGCPWKSHLFSLEKELSTEADPINIK